METYASTQKQLEERLEEVRQALPRDVASAIAKRDWNGLRDKYDVEALVAKMHDLWSERSFVAEIQAAADRTRAAQVGRRGRPRKDTEAAEGVKAAQAVAGAGAAGAAKTAAA